MELAGQRPFGCAVMQLTPDKRLVSIERERFLMRLAAFRPPHMLPFRLQPCQRFFRPLTDEIALNLGRESEGKSQYFRLDVIAQTITVFDGPYLTTAIHAMAEDLHYHI